MTLTRRLVEVYEPVYEDGQVDPDDQCTIGVNAKNMTGRVLKRK